MPVSTTCLFLSLAFLLLFPLNYGTSYYLFFIGNFQNNVLANLYLLELFYFANMHPLSLFVVIMLTLKVYLIFAYIQNHMYVSYLVGII